MANRQQTRFPNVSLSPMRQSRAEIINEWREQRQRIIDEIVRQAIIDATDRDRVISGDSFRRQLSIEDINNRKRDLFDHLDQLLEQYMEREWNLSEATEIDGNDNFATEDLPLTTPTDLSPSSSNDDFDINSDHTDALDYREYQRIPCAPDNNNGVMALHMNELVFANIIRQPGQQETEICVVSNFDTNKVVRRVPFIDSGKRVADMDYSIHYKRFVIAANKFAHAQLDVNDKEPYLYFFNTENDLIERWKPFDTWESIQRVCCTPSHIYLIIQSMGESMIAHIPNDNGPIHRQSADDLISLPLEHRFRLIDISCTASLHRPTIAVTYNGAGRNGDDGPIGIYLFDKNWMRVARISDLGNSNMPYSVPRLTWLSKPNILAMVNFESGQLIMFTPTGQKQDMQLFSRFAENNANDQTNLNPINICATLDWAAIRFGHSISIYRIND